MRKALFVASAAVLGAVAYLAFGYTWWVNRHPPPSQEVLDGMHAFENAPGRIWPQEP